MTELLAPAGNMEALKAAIASGCDALYLGMQRFGARAYSNNFDYDTLEEAIKYAHLRDVLIYVTMNTIVFEEEIEDMKEQLRRLNQIGVDGVIVQDLAVFDFIVENFVDMEAHCSTQMGIDDLEGTLLFKELGAKRVVLSREVPIEKVKEIKKIAKIPLEIFVHGALCVSYSGNCLMSGLIGYRSGNRGRCVGSCRKPYELINLTDNENLGESYILSTKDLNTVDHIDDLVEIDSLKIEGRMKEPAYVANVISTYRKAIDGAITKRDKENLKKTFNRTFTKGYLFGEDPRDITNISKPNNYGYEIGKITKAQKGQYEITLKSLLNQNDIIRIDHDGEDVNLSVVKLYDKKGDLINKATKTCYIRIKEQLSVGDIVYKTKDVQFYKELESGLDKEFRRFPLNFKVYGYPEANLVIEAEGFGLHYLYESEEVLSQAINNPTTKEQVAKQLSKLGDTVFEPGHIEFEEYDAFIPVKLLNSARREIVDKLYEMKLASKPRRTKNSPQESDSFAEAAASKPDGFSQESNSAEVASIPDAAFSNENAGSRERVLLEEKKPYLTATVTTKEQYDACRAAGIKEVYFKNIVRRNQNDYEDMEGQLLIGGYGGVYRYKDSNEFVTDYSMNVVNATSIRKLHQLGAKRVTISYELNKKQIGDMIGAYRENYGQDPCLEMVVYGRAPLMFTKYCPLRKMNQCGVCKTKDYVIRDEYGEFPILSHEDCTTTILNGKILNLMDEIPFVEGVEAFRLNFTIESASQVLAISKAAMGKLKGENQKTLFNRATDTRGHFNKEIM